MSETSLPPLHVSLPLVGVGAFTLLLSLCFCCYMWRLKRQGRVKEGYRNVTFASVRKKMQTDTCAVCLEEFSAREKIAFCHCHHGFHKVCLTTWLRQRNICPMCKTPVSSSPGERTGLVHQNPSTGTM